MSIRVAGQALRVAAFAGIVVGSASLAGCTTLGAAAFGDVTGSTGSVATAGGDQAMPATLNPIAPETKVASGPFVPPEDIGGSSGGGFVTGSVQPGSVSSSALPSLTGPTTMSAQPQIAPVAAPKSASLGSLPVDNPTPHLAVVSDNPSPPSSSGQYTHVIESGESLYTIARRYDVTAQAIVQANGMSSPDKIFVGQKIIIPGRPDLLQQKGPATVKMASIAPVDAPTAPKTQVTVPAAPKATTIASTDTPVVTPTPTVAPKAPAAEPQMSGADKFRWPVSGKVITDFIASKGQGINIDAPEGAAVRAAENGTVIYVGSGVEGYGNLVLIRHPNGYVSAYAHLKSASVAKGDAVNRGDSIGLVGMTGSVSRPQLHFELRQGATPVDPIPLLAG